MKFLPSKHRRAVWSRSIKGFWAEYRQNRIGLIGLAVVIFYVFVAVFARSISPYDPLSGYTVADGFAMPEWVTIFPGYGDKPRTIELQLSWTAIETLPESMEAIETGENLVIEYNGTQLQAANFTSSFLYPYDAPNRFSVIFKWWTQNVSNAQHSVEFFIINPAGNEFLLWTSYSSPVAEFSSINKSLTHTGIYSTGLQYHVVNRLQLRGLVNIAREVVFTESGEYKFRFQIKARPRSEEGGTVKIGFQDCQLRIPGLVHGWLGTDKFGFDILSQLIYGSQISMAVGLSSALLSTSIGILVGIISGYLGGYVDEGLMRLVDILMCIPVLPLLLGLIVIFGTSVWYLVLLIAVFGWLGLSRVIRSQVLSIKELPFIESARASGGTNLYIMLRHMLPNIIPVAMASLVLSVPAAILTEAGISFIGLGDPATPTWGRMLNWAFNTGAFPRLAWWWIIPPGAAITILTLAFVFIGFAVDAVVNPRLRRRR